MNKKKQIGEHNAGQWANLSRLCTTGLSKCIVIFDYATGNESYKCNLPSIVAVIIHLYMHNIRFFEV